MITKSAVHTVHKGKLASRWAFLFLVFHFSASYSFADDFIYQWHPHDRSCWQVTDGGTFVGVVSLSFCSHAPDEARPPLPPKASSYSSPEEYCHSLGTSDIPRAVESCLMNLPPSPPQPQRQPPATSDSACPEVPRTSIDAVLESRGETILNCPQFGGHFFLAATGEENGNFVSGNPLVASLAHDLELGLETDPSSSIQRRANEVCSHLGFGTASYLSTRVASSLGGRGRMLIRWTGQQMVPMEEDSNNYYDLNRGRRVDSDPTYFTRVACRPRPVSSVMQIAARNRVVFTVHTVTNLMGHDYSGAVAASRDVCQNRCALQRRCVAFSFVNPGVQGPNGMCWLKDSLGELTGNPQVTTGIRLLRTAQQ